MYANNPDQCTRCGKQNHSQADDECPARTQKCKKCGLIGHWALQCKTAPGKYRRQIQNSTRIPNYRKPTNRVRRISTENEEKPTSFIFAIGDGDEYVWVKIGGVVTQMLIDSGSKKNIIDNQSWEQMKKQGVVVRNATKDVDQRFRGYGNNAEPLQVIGMFDATVEVQNSDRPVQSEARFYVIMDGNQPLLGKETARQINVLRLGLPEQQNNIFKISTKTPFPKMKGIKLRIPIDASVTPVVQHARRPPIALLSRIEDKLKHLENADIIERVNGYSDWLSPLVVIVKDNGDLRLCVDMRLANKAIKREYHLMPTIDDFLPRLKTAKYFSRLDIKDAFHQVELDESSRSITTFITHLGMFRYKRLMFGISCAPEMYQKILEQLLASCDNCINYIDDIVVHGADEDEHNRCLKKVLDVLKSSDVLLNTSKCQFKVTELSFLGHHISIKGVLPAESKVDAIKQFRKPNDVEELRSFLGLVTYVGRFLPDLGTVATPLRALTHQGSDFVWTVSQEKAFQSLKNMISDVHHLKFFDNSLRTRVVADASPVALGAVLLQFQDNDNTIPRVICYASRSLTATEQRYCQTEKEALSLVWSVERFSQYLIGRIFELETDHKPLEAIFAPTSRPCPRIERWVLRLQSFTFNVKYRKGKANIADPLSRLPILKNQQDGVEKGDDKFLVLAILESTAIDVGEVEEASIVDSELTAVRECLRSGVWGKPEIRAYEAFQQELGMVGELVVRGNKLVIPIALRKRFLQLGHEGHPGESSMKKRLRDRVWWPGMDREISKFVASCEGCQLDVETALPNEEFADRDQHQKYHSAQRENERRQATQSTIGVGDKVLMRNLTPDNKLCPRFNPNEYTVMNKTGSRLTIQNPEDGRSYDRNAAHVKRVEIPEPRIETSSDAMPTEENPAPPLKRSRRPPVRLEDYVLDDEF
ncbi:uncharacterized protein K02A2.6-like [Uranotaenia lowii]|uniref:uncharacterized protein K02A2.6-like n=1 Tax=Uranotaenia lowii TaxID=190385 RepID=UPI0024783E01|nr:uncharacterized protein K02A2.6-like [Uranotaenia lowii]